MSAPELTPLQVRRILECGDLEVLGRMPWSSNATLLATAQFEGVELRVIYKPQRGERPLWDFEEGSLCRREVAAFALSEELGWNLVPVTVLRDGPFGVGAVQRFVDHDPDDHYFTMLESHRDMLVRFAAFDVLANNADRKSGHCILSNEGDTILGIDHGLTFHEEPKLRTVIWDFAGEPVPEELRGDIERVDSAGYPGLTAYLSSAEVAAVAARSRELLAAGTFPNPGDTHHSFPWPLV